MLYRNKSGKKVYAVKGMMKRLVGIDEVISMSHMEARSTGMNIRFFEKIEKKPVDVEILEDIAEAAIESNVLEPIAEEVIEKKTRTVDEAVIVEDVAEDVVEDVVEDDK